MGRDRARERAVSRKLGEAAQIDIDAPRSITMSGMGLRQHVHGSQNLAALTNLWLLKGDVGYDGTGISSVRGHPNVQGQRTVGISKRPELMPLDKLVDQFGFEPLR